MFLTERDKKEKKKKKKKKKRGGLRLEIGPAPFNAKNGKDLVGNKNKKKWENFQGNLSERNLILSGFIQIFSDE